MAGCGFLKRAAAGALVLAGMVAGCSPSTGPESKEPAAEPKAARPVAVRVIDENQFAQILRGYRGRPILVDFWATWCQPCKELFAHTVALHKQYADRGLVTISISFDDPSEEAKVLKFLQDEKATFDNYISRHGASPESAEAFHVDDGTLPHLQLYDRDGSLWKRFHAGKFKQADVDKALDALMGK